MSWLIGGKEKKEEALIESKVEVLYGLQFMVKKVGDDLVIQGKARTKSDIDRLKRITSEVFEEILEKEDEAKRSRSTHPRRKR